MKHYRLQVELHYKMVIYPGEPLGLFNGFTKLMCSSRIAFSLENPRL
jgi:hypothetical protein